MHINGDFRFCNVGQGLFYTGIITKVEDAGNVSRFVTVYDCGSSSKRKFLYTAIDDFKNILPDDYKKIDLLTISHFDADHINGLSLLLQKFQVETVVMPYLTIHERLFYLAGVNDKNISPLYKDPIQFFRDNKVKNIVITLRPEQELESIDRELNHEIVRGDDSNLNIDEINDNYNGNMNIKYYLSNLSIFSVEFYWNFIFFNKEVESKYLIEKIEKIMGSDNDLQKVLADKKKLAEIKKEYKNNCEKLNDTSVVLLHYPEIIGCLYLRGCNFPRHDIGLYRNFGHFGRIGTLMTGDISFKKYGKEINDWLSKIEYDDIDIISVPHHGAETSWDGNIVWQLDKYLRKLFVISYGISNKYGHPHYKVKYDILSKTHLLSEVNQWSGFNYLITLDL